VPGHAGVEGHERADELAKIGSEHPVCGPDPLILPRTGTFGAGSETK